MNYIHLNVSKSKILDSRLDTFCNHSSIPLQASLQNSWSFLVQLWRLWVFLGWCHISLFQQDQELRKLVGYPGTTVAMITILLASALIPFGEVLFIPFAIRVAQMFVAAVICINCGWATLSHKPSLWMDFHNFSWFSIKISPF